MRRYNHPPSRSLKEAPQAMAPNSQAALFGDSVEEHTLADALCRSRTGDDIKQDLAFLLEFNSDLERNAHLSRLNEKFLEQKMGEIDGHNPMCGALYECTRVRLHELLLLCAANYANNCEYAAMGDLMFNPRLILVHVRGCHQPVVKERHTPLTEQFQDVAGTASEMRIWLRDETTLEIKRKPLIPHSYELLYNASFIPQSYIDSARDRAVQIADLSAFLCSMEFNERMNLEAWLRRASQSDRDMVESRLLRLDWKKFRKFGYFIILIAHLLLDSKSGRYLKNASRKKTAQS
jgi:hypothetical protein